MIIFRTGRNRKLIQPHHDKKTGLAAYFALLFGVLVFFCLAAALFVVFLLPLLLLAGR